MLSLSLTTLAGILEALGERFARRAVAIGVESWGPDSPGVWWMQRGHAALLNALGRYAEAIEIMEPLVARIEVAPRQVELESIWPSLASASTATGDSRRP